MKRTNVQRTARSHAAILGLLLAAFLAASLVLSASPAYARDFTVLNTNDSGSGSLRRVIELANLTPGPDTIKFAIPGEGVKTISPASELPTITEQATIDGYSQTGARPNTQKVGSNASLLIELNGANTQASSSGPDGLVVGPGASNSVVKGLVVNRFGDDGITVGAGATNVRVEGNFVGTDPTGRLDRGNGDDGVFEGGSINNVVGGTAPEARNLISGNGGDGVVVFFGAKNTRVEGNLIGTKRDGTSVLGNSGHGVFINNASNNTVGGPTVNSANTIAFNGKDGVMVSGFDPVGNRILGNSIFANTGLGIDLNDDGSTPNDLKDADTGPNDLQNKPVLTSATTSGSTFVRGTLNSVPNTVFQIQFFSSPSGNQGKKVVGIDSLTTDANGNATFNSPVSKVAAGQRITATAIDFVGGNTSEFSAPRTVVAQ